MNRTFEGLGIAPKLLAILSNNKFIEPTPIQEKSIPVANEGKDMIGIAQTGTGKTLAFVLPMIQRIARTKKRGLVILPTRELAEQVAEQVKLVGDNVGVRSALIIGGSPEKKQLQELKKNPHIIIGTPGRLVAFLKSNQLNLNNVGIVVLDEADRMLDMGFAPDMKRILEKVPTKRQTMLFSATMPKEIVKLAMQYMKAPVRVEVARAGSITDQVDQELFIVAKQDKLRLLEKLLADYQGTVLVFSRTKHGAKKIRRVIASMGHQVAELHSNLNLSQRRRSLEGFKSGKYRILVATDIAARGIDVDNIELVVNFDIPDNADDYVHRVGRTGRAGKIGKAISFAMPDQKKEVEGIERLVKQQLQASPLPELPPARIQPKRNFPQRGNKRPYQDKRKSRHGSPRRNKPRRGRVHA